MGCVPSFLFDPKALENIPYYSESKTELLGHSITVTKETMENNLYIIINPSLIKTIENRKARILKSFRDPLQELMMVFESIEKEATRVKAQSDQKPINQNSLWYIKFRNWDKTLSDEINARVLKKARFEELELWNLLYFATCVFATMEATGLPIDRIFTDDFVIIDKKFRYFYQAMTNQKEIMMTEDQARQHNQMNFQTHFLQLMGLLLFMSFLTVPMSIIYNILQREEKERKEIVSRLHEMFWAKYYPAYTKSESTTRVRALF